jgi:dihydrofolate synthase/folylpolyglutamate synthase
VSDPLEYLFALEQFGMKFGLENIRTIVAALNHPERAFRSIHVAGTNGKGSVTAMVEACLRTAGHRTGRYTSPHLVDLRERFAIDGRTVAQEDLVAAVDHVRHHIERLRDEGVLPTHPTFFEVTTAVAFELFRRAGVEIAVCEVGLGGRLDATNVLSPMVCAITSIAFDHEQYLGTTLSDISYEKAGIIKSGTPVVVGDVPPEAEAVIRRVAAERSAPIINADRVGIHDIEVSLAATRASFETSTRRYGHLTLGLTGPHQIGNAQVAIGLLESVDAMGVPVPEAAIREGLAHVDWPGRLQRLTLDDGREALLDAAHNPSGARSLAAVLEREPTRPLVFATMRDKDAAGILQVLAPVASHLVITRASNPRSADPISLLDVAHRVAPELPAVVADTPAAALAAAWRAGDAIVVAGSIFLLGDVLKTLGRS